MDRRTYLDRCAAIGAVASLAGCTEQSLEEAKKSPPWIDPYFDEEEVDLPVTQKFGISEEAIERAEDETFEEPTEFEEYLREEEVAVESVEEVEKEGKTVLELEYVVGEVTDEGNAHSAGIIAGAYAALVRGDYDGNELEISMLEPDGSIFGEFEIVTQWAEEYNEGKKSAAVYGGEVVHTLESR